jgi:hypothetical protein
VAVTFIGLGHVGGCAQVTLATQPGLFTDPSLLNLNVKQPVDPSPVNGPGIAVPQNDPANPPGTFAAGFALAICGAVIEFPLNTYNPSQLASVLNEVKVTVTCSPVVVGHMVTVLSALFG